MTTATLDVSLEQLEAAALRLDSNSRTQLAFRLLDSVPADFPGRELPESADWIEEAEQRVQKFLDNNGEALDGEQVFRDARAKVR
jgi:hypothetical protein